MRFFLTCPTLISNPAARKALANDWIGKAGLTVAENSGFKACGSRIEFARSTTGTWVQADSKKTKAVRINEKQGLFM